VVDARERKVELGEQAEHVSAEQLMADPFSPDEAHEEAFVAVGDNDLLGCGAAVVAVSTSAFGVPGKQLFRVACEHQGDHVLGHPGPP
jgi:hypothetical protein